MILRFFGGAQEVGRSAIMLKDDRSLMFDYGIKIDKKLEYPVGMPKIDGLVLSHAHLDHSGFSAALYSEMFIPTFGTPPTLRLSNLLLDDSLSIARKEHVKPKFSRRQVQEFVNRYISLDYHHPAHFGNYDIEFFDAGHICGSSVTLVERTKAKDYRRIVYTGDFKLEPQTLHTGAEVVKGDLLIMESTYAQKEHANREKTIKTFIDKINETLQNGGTALIPAFAVGRSQELLTILGEHGLASSTYIDGMAKEATSIVMNHPKFIENYEHLAKAARDVTWIGEARDRKAVLNEPSIVLTTSGMLNGGPVLNYLTRLNKKSHIFLTGFQQEGTNGKMLTEKGFVIIDKVKKKISTPVTSYDFSAHAGEKDLHEYVKRCDPSSVVCIHGDEHNAKALAASLKEEGYDAYAPRIGDTLKFPD